MKYRKKKIGELLVEGGFLSEEELLKALKESRRKGMRIGTYLIERENVPPIAVATALAKQNRLGYLDLSNHEIDPEAIRYISEATARKYCLIPRT